MCSMCSPGEAILRPLSLSRLHLSLSASLLPLPHSSSSSRTSPLCQVDEWHVSPLLPLNLFSLFRSHLSLSAWYMPLFISFLCHSLALLGTAPLHSPKALLPATSLPFSQAAFPMTLQWWWASFPRPLPPFSDSFGTGLVGWTVDGNVLLVMAWYYWPSLKFWEGLV